MTWCHPAGVFIFVRKEIHFRNGHVTFKCVFTDFLSALHVSGCCVVFLLLWHTKEVGHSGGSEPRRPISLELPRILCRWLADALSFTKRKKRASYTKCKKNKKDLIGLCVVILVIFLFRHEYWMWVRQSGVVCHRVIGEGGGEWEWSNKL